MNGTNTLRILRTYAQTNGVQAGRTIFGVRISYQPGEGFTVAGETTESLETAAGLFSEAVKANRVEARNAAEGERETQPVEPSLS